METQHEERRLTTILSADVVGYSRLMGEDEAGTLAALKAHRRELIEPKTAEYHGRGVKLMGDGTLMEFGSVVDAVLFAVDVQRAMLERNASVPEDRRITYRVGINIGDIIVEGDDIYGDGVNIAARLEALAEPGGICVARNVYNQVKAKINLNFEHLGEKEVKNIAEAVSTYRVLIDKKATKLRTPLSRRAVTRHWRWAVSAAAVLLFAMIGGGLLWLEPWAPEVEPASVQNVVFSLPDKPSIAVLPFYNLSADPEQEYFSDGITNDIITDLSKFQSLFVIAAQSTLRYKGKPVMVQEVAKDLGVRYVLEGSVQTADRKLRINAQLIDTRTESHVWAERYDRELRDIFDVQNEIVRNIAGIIGQIGVGRGKLQKVELERISRTRTENLTAYDYFLRGTVHFDRFSKDDNILARQMFEKAIELDPGYALAIAEKAITHVMDYRYQWSGSPQDSLRMAEQFVLQAIEIDNTEPVALWALAMVHIDNARHDQAINALEKAYTLNPNNAGIIMRYGYTLAAAGRPDEGIQFMKKAIRLNPYHPKWYKGNLAVGYFFTKQYEETIATLLKITDPHQTAYLYLAASYAQLGQIEKARATVGRLLKLEPQISLDHQVKRRALKYKNPDYLKRFADGLRKAGLPD